jgi:ABC-type transport system involved in cytochrome c biogenesis permease component
MLILGWVHAVGAENARAVHLGRSSLALLLLLLPVLVPVLVTVTVTVRGLQLVC